MAISNQIARLQTLRNSIRTKLINIGLLPAASTSATLSECYNVLSSVTGLSAMSYTPTTTAQTIASGQYLNGVQTINAIPSVYIVPTGTSTITSNSVYDITQYASVSVNVQPALQSKTVTPTQAVQSITPDTGVYGLSKVTVNAIPSAYIIPSGTITLSSSGTFDVGSYASADVTVIGGGDTNVYLLDKYNRTLSYNISIDRRGSDYIRLNPSYYGVNMIYTNSISAYGFAGFLLNNSSFYYHDETVKYIGSNAFRDMTRGGTGTGGVDIDIYDWFPNIKFISSYAFYSNKVFDHITIPNLSSIDGLYNDGVFAYMSRVKWISLANVSLINGRQTFFGCSNLESLYLPNLTRLSAFNNAAWFAYCSKLSSLYLPELAKITEGGSAFMNCTNLSILSMPKLSYWDAGENAFIGAVSLTELSLPELLTLTYVNNPIFSGTNIRKINFPKMSYTSKALFLRASNLIEVNLPLLESISCFGLFSNCTKISEINLPRLKTIIGGATFGSCYSLVSLSLPELETLESCYGTFAGCTSLSTINLPKLKSIIDAGTSIYSALFSQCSSIYEINMPCLEFVSGVGAFAFLRNSSVSISAPLLSSIIGSYCFYYYSGSYLDLPELSYCSGGSLVCGGRILSASFPKLTTLNGSSMFYSCSFMSTINISNVVTMSGGAMFYGCSKLLSIYIPNFQYTTDMYQWFYGNSSISTAWFSATSMLSGRSCFCWCPNLVSIFLLGSSVCTLGLPFSSFFFSTGLTSSATAWRFGSIYVPQSLLATYKAATNWTTVSSKIFAYESYFGTIGSFGYVDPTWTPFYEEQIDPEFLIEYGNGWQDNVGIPLDDYGENHCIIEFDGVVYPLATYSSNAIRFGAPISGTSSYKWDYYPFHVNCAEGTIVCQTSESHTFKMYSQLP